MPLKGQFGFKSESTWGTAVTVDTFIPLLNWRVKRRKGHRFSRGLAAGLLTPKVTGFVGYSMGAEGSAEVEVTYTSFGLLFKHATGAVATTGPTDSNYSHAFTQGSTKGLGLTAQVNTPYIDESNQALTYAG